MTPKSLTGPIHGLVFLAFGACVLAVAVNQRWSRGPTLVALVAAVVPLATVPLERSFIRAGRLEGRWRTEASDHPGDQHRLDALFRWLLGRPVVLLSGASVGVLVVFAGLLVVGPPGG